MKKIIKFLLILIIFTFNINVLATENNNLTDDSNEASEPTKSNDATLTNVVINEQKVVCSNNVCELIIKDNNVNSVKITYDTNDSKAKVSPEKIEESLKDGENSFEAVVTAEDNTSKKYTFKVIKQPLSTDSTLSKLLINGTEIKLNKNEVKCQTTVSYSTKKIEIEAIPTSSTAKVEGAINNKISYDFFDSKKEIKLKVQAEAGDITTYVITVTKREEADTTLKTLKINNDDIDFESGVFDYELKVLKNVTELEVEAIPTDTKANVKIDKPKNLEIGENTVKIEVENDGNTNTYVVKVTKLNEEDSSLANLESLKIEGYDIDFKEDKYEYNLKIGDVNYLVIDTIPKVEDAEVEITGNLDLVDGSIIKIKVIYDSETYNVYKINIIKEESVNANDNSKKIIIIVVIILIIIASIVLLVIQLKKKKRKDKNNKGNNRKNKDDSLSKKEEKMNNSNEDIQKQEEMIDII